MSKIKWGPYLLPATAATEHFLFVGSTGSGKSVLIKTLMNSAFAAGAMKLGSRGVVYDAKGDILPFLHQLLPADRIQILHPFDQRSWAWDIAKDVTSLLAARQIASILVPDPERSNGSDQFFNEAARELLMAAMIALMHSKKAGHWTLRDLLLLVMDVDDLSQILKQSGLHTPSRIQKQYLEDADDRTRANILATLSTKIGAYEPVAAAWETSAKRLSIRDWIKSGNLLVLGNDESARASLDPINRALFQCISEQILNLPEQTRGAAEAGQSRTWVVVDEFREAGKLLGLRALLNKGRSKGACVVLGCQDVEGVRAVYGKEEGAELLAQCLNTVVLNLANPETAQWAANLFGTGDMMVESTGETQGSSWGQNESEKLERKTLVTTHELLTMPRIGPLQGWSGYYKSPALENSTTFGEVPQYVRICPWRFGDRATYSWEKIIPYLRINAQVPAFMPKSATVQYLRTWTPAERQSIGLSPASVNIAPTVVSPATRAAILPHFPTT